MSASTTVKFVSRKADEELSERGKHRRERVRLGIMQCGLRRLEAQVAQQDIVTGLTHQDDPVDFSTQRGVSYWPERNVRSQFHWQDEEPMSDGFFPSTEQFARQSRRVEVEYRTVRPGRTAAVYEKRQAMRTAVEGRFYR